MVCSELATTCYPPTMPHYSDARRVVCVMGGICSLMGGICSLISSARCVKSLHVGRHKGKRALGALLHGQ